MGLLRWWRSWRLERRVKKGKQTWGRQPEGQVKVEQKKGQPAGHMPVDMKGQATISARVYRAATDTWEDLGVISEPGKEK